MIRNYLKIALRNIKRHSTYSILNISGMAIGMASAILILLWVQDEWSYDRHFDHADELYRVIENQYFSGGEVSSLAATPGALSYSLKKEYPEIIRSSRFTDPPLTLKNGDEFVQEKIAIVDKDFIKMFNIGFVHGDINTALDGPHNIVITDKMARKYFGTEDALGKTFTEFGNVLTITGVVKSLPHNSHIRFDIIFPFERVGAPVTDWSIRCYNYIELKKGTDSKKVEKKILDFIKRNKKGTTSEIFLQNIKKIHLYSSRKYVYDIIGHGDITYVRILSLIAVFILLIACINFMNLATAQSARRAREIGVRKMAGANKRTIITQFLGESMIIVLVAHAIAMIFVELLLPGFSNLIGKQLAINYESAGLYLGLISIVLFCGLLAGSYPAFYLSSLKPLNTIKGIINKNPGKAGFRRVLVIFQFSLSVLLIICTLIVESQLKYIQNKKPGLNIDNISYFQFSLGMQRETLKKDLSNNPDIVCETIAGENTFISRYSESGFNWAGKKEGDDALFQLLFVDEDYAKTFQLKLKEGRFFSNEFSTDNSAIVINEKAAEIIGFKDPIGEMLTNSQGLKLKIIGVVKDFHYQSLHTRIESLIMHMGEGNFCFIRMKPERINSAVEYIRKTFKSYNLTYPLELKFLDDEYDKLYQTEQRMGKIFGYFSFLAIIISCLGLIGLSTFMILRRTKEIGIRKAHGAKSIEIFLLLSKEYFTMVIISFIIASPISWYVVNKWLQNFAYRTNIGWRVFALTGVMVMVIAMLAVGFQTYKASSKNPVEALRYE
jgi:putative ABC transport system permease protein